MDLMRAYVRVRALIVVVFVRFYSLFSLIWTSLFIIFVYSFLNLNLIIGRVFVYALRCMANNKVELGANGRKKEKKKKVNKIIKGTKEKEKNEKRARKNQNSDLINLVNRSTTNAINRQTKK
jgi:uncharacterized membrane protein